MPPSILSNVCLCVAAAMATSARPDAATIPDAAPLTEQRRDRAQAAASYALAKTLYARSDLAGALRAYQRAWQWDPTRDALLDEVVPLAVSLGRADEAIRYAIIQATRGRGTPEMLRRLALYAAESHQWSQAAQLYELWLGVAPAGQNSFERSLIQIELGRLYERLGEFDRASAAVAGVQSALVDRPDSELSRRLAAGLGGSLSQVFEAFGRSHLEAGELTLASQAFSRVRDEPTGDAARHYWLAALALEKSQPLEAYAELREYFQQPDEPLGPEPYQLLRSVLISLNDRKRWPVELERLRRELPASLYAMRADALQRAAAGRDDEAAALLRRVVDSAVASEAPIDQQSFDSAANWLLEHYAEQEEANRVLPLVAQLAQVDSTLRPHAAALRAAMRSDAFADQLEARLRMLLRGSEQPHDEVLAAARLALVVERHQLAADLLRHWVKSAGEGRGPQCIEFAVDLLLAEQDQIAAGLLREFLDAGVIDSDEPVAWYYLSAALSASGTPDEAVEHARRAADLAPESPEFALNVARTLQVAGRIDEALDAFGELFARFEANADSSVRQTLRDARLSRSYLLLREGQTDAAAEQLQLVLDEFPGDPGASNDLGYLWADRGAHLERALRLTERAVDAEPENPAYLDSYGWASFKLGRLDHALKTLKRAVAITPDADPEILDHLGQTHAARGDRRAALDAWRQALKAAESPALADAITGRIHSIREGDGEAGAPAAE